MPAAVYRGRGKLEVEDRPVPPVGPEDVLVEVSHCGVCGSDLHFVLEGWGRPGSVGGHEYAGRLVEKAMMADLLRNPLHPYARALLQAIPDADAANSETYRQIPAGEPPSLLHPPPGCRFHPRCPVVIPDLCDTQEPPEFEPEPLHQTLCWLYKEEKP